MKKYIIIFICLFVSVSYSMDREETLSELLTQWQQSVSKIKDLSLENEQLEEEIKRLERRPKKGGCLWSKRRFYSLAKNACVAIFIGCTLDQLFWVITNL